MIKRKLCFVTGSRADYGLLSTLMADVRDSSDFELQIVVTGMHLSSEFGSTVNVIQSDGFNITTSVETLLSSDTSIGVCKSIGLGVISFSEVFDRLKPDLVILLGDRYEIFAAAQAAYFSKIPIAHIGGGDVTEGAYDEAMRHGISKMSHIHFVTNSLSMKRLGRMGENENLIFNVGSPGLDCLSRMALPAKNIIESELNIRFLEKIFLITFHPVTIDVKSSLSQLDAMLEALNEFGEDTSFIFTLSNSDTGGRELNQRIKEYVSQQRNAALFPSLGQRLYFGMLSISDVVIGNSSSGLYEAPSLNTPTVNIGMRQSGRIKALSVFDAGPNKNEIVNAIKDALKFGKKIVQNPYGQGDCAKQILERLRSIPDFHSLALKQFYDGS